MLHTIIVFLVCLPWDESEKRKGSENIPIASEPLPPCYHIVTKLLANKLILLRNILFSIRMYVCQCVYVNNNIHFFGKKNYIRSYKIGETI